MKDKKKTKTIPRQVRWDKLDNTAHLFPSIAGSLNPELKGRDVLINSVMGLCGESGEAIDIVKKWLAQGHPLDREHLAKELGDVAWYLAEAATALDLDLEDILRANLEKLERRYPDGFSTEKSVGRDKNDL